MGLAICLDFVNKKLLSNTENVLADGCQTSILLVPASFETDSGRSSLFYKWRMMLSTSNVAHGPWAELKIKSTEALIQAMDGSLSNRLQQFDWFQS